MAKHSHKICTQGQWGIVIPNIAFEIGFEYMSTWVVSVHNQSKSKIIVWPNH